MRIKPIWVLIVIVAALTGMSLGQPSPKKELPKFRYSLITTLDPNAFNTALAKADGEVLPESFRVVPTTGIYTPAVYSILVRNVASAEKDQ